jgi:ubiquitin-activating enzyme E1
MGHEAQQRLMVSDVLIVGLSGLGVEVAKNVILAGVKSVTLYDPNPATAFDLGANFYLSQADLGKPRAECVRKALSELNQYVPVTVATTLSPQGFACCAVTTPMAAHDVQALNADCRANSCAFIYSNVAGVFSQSFCDFGSDFVVADADGEQPHMSQIEAITVSNPGVVKVLEDHGRHNLETGDVVKFTRVQGMPELSDTEHTVKVTGPYTFEIGDCSAAAAAATQGYIMQVKQPVTVSFSDFATLSANPGDIMFTDYAKMDRPPVLHAGFAALATYLETNPAITPGNTAAAEAVAALAKAANADLTDEQLTTIKQLALGSPACISPMCAAIGGIVGQEVLKSVSGKFMPIKGFMYFDAEECLPAFGSLPVAEVAPRNTRYDSQIAIFGATMQEKIMDQSYFLVGAGAIGCETLKNWCMMGLGCGPKGKVFITDMDTIEKSNLSRQFLFRSSDIGFPKSVSAAKKAKEMNSDMNITAFEEKMCAETEAQFGDAFFDSLTGVCNALDNVHARLYMDGRCMFYQLPLYESGTLGTKGNVQICVPRLTENYGATRDPPEKSIPVCTLKNFPNQIEHTLQWSRDYFEGAFFQQPADVNTYLSGQDASSDESSKVDTLLSIKKNLVDERPYSFEECLTWARLLFEELYSNSIKQLLHNFPPDQLTSTGTPFWSGTKRCPNPVTFDLDARDADTGMRNHFDFIISAATLRASVYGLSAYSDEEKIKKVLNNVMVPDFVPKEGVKIAANEAEAKENDESKMSDVDDGYDSILKELPEPKTLAGMKLNPVEFDKDIDDHMVFVTACSNLRALNYSIPTEDMHRSRAIAGKIIPAIATTTALVTGLVGLEAYKVIGTAQNELKVEVLKSAFLNLAIPFVTLSEPAPPVKTKCVLKGEEWNWSAWDCLDIDVGDITLDEFLEYFKTTYNLDVSMLSYGVSIIFSFFANKAKLAARRGMKMSAIVEEIKSEALPDSQKFLVFEVITEDVDTGDEVDLPYCRYRFKK